MTRRDFSGHSRSTVGSRFWNWAEASAMERAGNMNGLGSSGSKQTGQLWVMEIVGAHSEAAHVLVVVLGPSVAPEAVIPILKEREHVRVEIGQTVVDPLLPKLIISTKIRRQPLHGVQEARHASLRVARGVPHRSSLCTSVSVIGLSLAAP
eukprot:scaffold9905_cov117-Isochrysis_galbana.AAC.9